MIFKSGTAVLLSEEGLRYAIEKTLRAEVFSGNVPRVIGIEIFDSPDDDGYVVKAQLEGNQMGRSSTLGGSIPVKSEQSQLDDEFDESQEQENGDNVQTTSGRECSAEEKERRSSSTTGCSDA